jgi:hypothetical protein
VAVAVGVTAVSVNQINRAGFSMIGLAVGKVSCGIGEECTLYLTVRENCEMLTEAGHHRLAGKQGQNEYGYRTAKFKHWFYCKSFV